MSPPDRASRHRKRSFIIAAAALGLLAAAPALAANGSVVYTYDALGRLTTASYDTGVCIAYTYDANGNRLSEKILVTSPTSTGMWGCFNWSNARWGP
ncbi:MAG: RHS repeat protein [Reyranella sp.]|jgi:YD repeat-containing protein|nr:RHS repeat protein [Reyranella sp.]